MQTSLRMMAKSMQFYILNYRNKDAVVQESKQDHSVECLLKAGPELGSGFLSTFETVVLNTPARMKAYYSANDQMSGQVFTLLNDSELSSICGF